MSDLQARPLGELIQIRKGKKPASVSPRQQNEAQRPYLLIDSFGGNYKSFTDDTSCPYAKADETLLVWDGERCGLTSTGHEGYIGSTLSAICTTNENLEPNYLFHFLVSKQKEIRNSAEGTGVPHVSRRSLEDLEIVIPPLPEQKKIAEILSGIDLVLDRILTKIRKLKYAKLSTIESILKRGTKGSEIIQMDGEEIPCTWQSKRLNQVCRRVCVGFVGTCEPFYRADGIPLIRTGNLKNGNLDTKEVKFVTREFHDKEKKSKLSPGDLLIARHGDFGSACIVPQELTEANCLNVVIIKPDYSVLLPDFLKITLNSLRMKGQFSSKAEGSTQKVISTTEIANSVVLVPPISEQAEIAKGISSIEDTINSLELSHKSLVALKSSVVQDLLSGRMRVSI